MLNLGIIGFGEAGYYLTKNLIEGSVQVYTFDVAVNQEDERAELIACRARENSVILADSMEDLFEKVEIVFCLTSAGSAVPVAKSIKSLLRPGQVYIDLNSTSPQTKEEIAAALDGAEGIFVEGAVMGAVPAKMTQVPINVCGPDAGVTAQRLNAAGLNIHVVEGKIGSASAMKMFKSILSKGMIALISETVFCTEKYGLTKPVLEDLINTINQMTFDGFCNYVVTQAAVHHVRLSKEMEEVVKTLDSLGENSIMTQAVRDKFVWMTEQGFADYFKERPATYDEVVAVKRKMEGKK
ncbi:DUF1932 domain-containing protein [Clostridium sp. MCC353]|uniref:NAD(P)-binding domain-containing protein n=1 Tax=Clostridium sp. MCC353 TaxID=2592646 RepID=UPI001C01905B|nr:NAD(P)-binding domain-containing protein [Clostridium sp. MCC353]MBT9778686.1 DUF1932 domain-containing protein [Clostridium sp. MCC353]